MSRKPEETKRRSRWLSLLLLAAPLAAQAASISVTPIRLTLSAQHPTGVLHVNNKGSDSELVQVQLVAWSQQDGRDVYAPAPELLATPPIFRLAGGATQVLRVGLRGTPAAGKETTYRLFLTQVPPAPTPGEVGLKFALRVSLPIFVDPAAKTAPILRWSAKLASPTKLVLQATNVGTAHVQILGLELGLPPPRKPASPKAGNYILPGNTASWRIKLKRPLAPDAKLGVSAKSDQGDFHAQVTVGK